MKLLLQQNYNCLVAKWVKNYVKTYIRKESCSVKRACFMEKAEETI